MKKFILYSLFCLVLIDVYAQRDAKSIGDVTLEMADGRKIRGWNRTKFINVVKFIEISAEPNGKRIRYDNDQVVRIVGTNGLVYVQRECIGRNRGKKSEKIWLRQEYAGKGISLYSAYVENIEGRYNGYVRVSAIHYFIGLGNDPAVYVSIIEGAGKSLNETASNRSMLNHYFSKRYPRYSDFAARIKKKEFDVKKSPLEVVKAWEQTYARR